MGAASGLRGWSAAVRTEAGLTHVGTLSALVVVGTVHADSVGRCCSGERADKKSLELHDDWFENGKLFGFSEERLISSGIMTEGTADS